MSELSGLEGLESLHRDLLALSESRLLNIERLCAQLESRIDEFRNFLHKSPRNEESRRKLETGKLEVLDVQYAISQDFQQGTLQLADALDLDEMEAARIFLESQDAAEALGRSVLESSIIRFHQTRKYLLDCFRLVLQESVNANLEDGVRDMLQEVVGLVLQAQNNAGNGLKFVRECLQNMCDIRLWLQALADKLNSVSVLGQASGPEFSETVEYQRVSLIQQHESLGIILHYTIKSNYSTTADFEQLLEILKKVEKNDNLLVHLLPAVAAFISVYGAQEGMGTLREARLLNKRLLEYREHDPWALHYVYSAVCAWWLADYSGWYLDNPTGSPLMNVNLDDENKLRTKHFIDSLKDGAFDFTLSIAADVKSAEWFDPTRRDLREWLQLKAPPLLPDSSPFSEYFQTVVVEQLESFIDAFITNMPDVLRKLRVDEDEQRQLSQAHEHDLDLERFLVIIAFAFEGRPDAAQAFWSDPDSNLAGFLSWASRRASTPLVSAFCEMLQALSEDEECATAAHEFLLDEGPALSGKMRRSHSLTWSQIFKELTFFSARIRDRPALPQSNFQRGARQNNDQVELEPEENLMLQSYLRLISRLCSESQTARLFILKHPTFHITDLLYQLASIPTSTSFPRRRSSRLRACAFNTLKSLLSHKTRDVGDFIWMSLDVWMSGGYTPTSQVPKTSISASASGSPMNEILQEIRTGFEESNAFIQLLQALIAPYEEETGLNDSLPFPELLGSSNRMPGIDPYVDFVGEVFGTKAVEVNDPLHARLLSLTCLDFIALCLSTFNEDLVTFASQSTIAVDNAIRTTDLTTYLRLHPFSKLMPWMFNDHVMAALFATMHQDVAEVGNAAPDSPLVLSILSAIHVTNLVMDLQATYINIVRPMVKLQPMPRRDSAANAAFASFEDGVLNNLFVIADLGLYCGVGHPPLTIAALKLLEKLSTSSKLVNPPTTGLGRFSDRNKAIAALESNNDAESIARSLINELVSPLELEQGPQCDTYVIKEYILDFLNSCLQSSPIRPSIAHLILGFQCGSDSIDIGSHSTFADGTSLFHNILSLAIEYPIGDDTGIIAWAISLKYKAIQVLKTLWTSPLTSNIVMGELRNNDFMISVLTRDIIVNSATLWDARTIEDSDFTISTSSTGLIGFIRYRAASLQYAASELRRVAQEHVPSVRERLLMALQGYGASSDGLQTQNPTIFDLFDFMELEVPVHDVSISLSYLKDLDLSVCLDTAGGESLIYNLKRVEELLILRHNELRTIGQLKSQQDENSFDLEAQTVVLSVQVQNQQNYLKQSRLSALHAWVQAMVMIIETDGLEGTKKTVFVLQALQVIIPKLERYGFERLDECLSLANLARLLIFSIDFSPESFRKGDMGDLASDRLFQLFRVCLRAIHSPIADPPLKEALYGICYRYLTGMSDIARDSALIKRHSTYTIKSAGERLMNVICDDAFAGDQTCRISALLLLGAFVTLARQEGSQYIIESLVRLNFIALIVDSIKNIVGELRDSQLEEVDLQVTFSDARLALLLNIAQTRFGATAVCDSGLFQAVKLSGLFSTDPDLGVDINDSGAIKVHYSLLSAAMRVLNATVFSRGPENEHTLRQGRKFLLDNRLSILTVFKRSARIGLLDQAVPDESVEALAESYMLLISLTGYLDIGSETSRLTESTTSIFT